MNVAIALDNDSAGQKGTKNMYDKLSRYFNLDVITLPDGVDDPGEATLEQLGDSFERVSTIGEAVC